jgi:hypothetical protein
MKGYLFIMNCPLFDIVQIDTAPSAISTSFTINSKRSIRDGLNAVKTSPFQTVFVIDAEKKKAIFTITRNIQLFNESRKKRGGGGEGLSQTFSGRWASYARTQHGPAFGCMLRS